MHTTFDATLVAKDVFFAWQNELQRVLMICDGLSNFVMGNCPPAQSVSQSEFAKVGNDSRSKRPIIFLDSLAQKQPLSNQESLVWMPECSCRMPRHNRTASIVQMEGTTQDHWAFLGSSLSNAFQSS